MKDFNSLSGRVVLVTGAGSGLGAALCAQLVEDGARVAAVDIDEARAHALVAQLRRPEASIEPFVIDVGSAPDVRRGLDQAIERFGRLDAIVNCAGVDVTVPIEELEVEAWERVLCTNLTGPFLMSKLALSSLEPGGHIVNVASTAALRAWPNASAYHASKWGLLGLTYAMHAELRSAGIKVSAIVAGGMRTPFLLDRFPDIDPEVLQDPGHVARAICFVLTQPGDSVIPEIMVLPVRETSWP
ncbi:MAG: SDR family oxidoreductase [Pigmentiphaga sp.]|nr:SDR family oxidoreductase [Pigmentiphaga sp.]